MRNRRWGLGVVALLAFFGLARCEDSAGSCDTGDADACLACMDVLMPGTGSGGECQLRLDECQANGDCESWRACRGTCWQNDPSTCCMDDCDGLYPGAGDEIKACMCDGCAAECAFLCQ
jgi:hypothetical protein